MYRWCPFTARLTASFVVLALATGGALSLHLSTTMPGAIRAYAQAALQESPTAAPVATLQATATLLPTAATTAIPTAADTPTAVTSVAAGPRSPLIISLQVKVAAAQTGGTAHHYSQTLQVFVPTGAVTTGVSLQVRVPALSGVPELTGQPGEQNNAGVGMVFDVNAMDVRTGQSIHGLNSNHPVVLQFTYDPTQVVGIDPTSLRVCYFDSGDWRPLPTTVDTFHHVLTAITDHFTLFAVRVTARTPAQITQAKARLAALADAGPPQVSVLPVSQTTVGGLPLIISIPTGHQHAPLSVEITGGPRAQVQLTFTLAGTTVVQTLSLDGQGYAATAFVPAVSLHTTQQLRVAVTVAHGGAQATTTRVVTLLPGQTTGPIPPGAPALQAILSASRIKVGTTGPLLSVATAPGATVRAALRLAGQPLNGLQDVTATADRHGSAHLQLLAILATMLNDNGAGQPPTLQVVVTATLGGYSTQFTMPLTITR